MVCMGMVARVFSVQRSSGSRIRHSSDSVSCGICLVAMKMDDSFYGFTIFSLFEPQPRNITVTASLSPLCLEG